MGQLRYDFPEESNPMESCIKLSKKIQNMNENGDVQKIIRHSYIKENLDVTLLSTLCEMFCKPERLNVYLHSKEFKDECIMQENFMRTRFQVLTMPKDLYSAITEPTKVIQMNNKIIAIPKKNKLLTTDFSLKVLDPKYTAQPQQISTWTDTDVWFHQDALFM